MEKIKNYNQKILAALGTILLLAATLGLIVFIVFLVSELIPDGRPARNVLLSDEKADALKEDSLRGQIISYDAPILVDTPNLVYIIPATVKTLEKPEYRDEKVMDLLDYEYSSSTGKGQSYYYYSAFNNLMVYDYRRDTIYKICDDRIIGEDLSYRYFDDDVILTFTGAEKDTDNDGAIDFSDFKSLYIYSLRERRLKKIDLQYATVHSFSFVEERKDILVNFGFDRNKDNRFDSDTEPSFIMKYDYQMDSLSRLVKKDLEIELQKIIDKS